MEGLETLAISTAGVIALSLLNITLTSGTLFRLARLEVLLSGFKERLEKLEAKFKEKFDD